MSRYMVFDLETTTGYSHKRKANPFNPDNWIVAQGWKVQGDTANSYLYFKNREAVKNLQIPSDVSFLVGFNIKFDLLWTWGNETVKAFFKRGGKIWCCQYAEYLLNAQQEKYHMCSMNDIAPSYGGTTKIDAVKEMWEAGIDTPDIPEDLLVDYLIGTEEEGRHGGDIRNTELIFLGQVKRMRELGMTKAMALRMDGLLCTTEMEYNGIKVDTVEAYKRLAVLEAEFQEAFTELNKYVPEFPEDALTTQGSNIPMTFNWNSIYHKSALIYGGVIQYRRRVHARDEDGNFLYTKEKIRTPLFGGKPVQIHAGALEFNEEYDKFQGQDEYKSGKKKGSGKWINVEMQGKPKTKLETFSMKLDGFVGKPDKDWPVLIKSSWKSSCTDAEGGAIYSTGGEALDILAKMDVPFCKVLGKYVDLNKEIGTYYERTNPETGAKSGMLTCVGDDGIIHHSLNHTSTVTGRLSGSNPNMQNISRGDKSQVKKMFVSRFGDEGCMIEIDYSQLEVVGQGVLTKDPKLCADLNNKIDFHCKRVAIMYNISYEEAVYLCKDENAPDHALWKKRRTNCKNFSFQRAYGAGAKSIALATGMTEDEVKLMIENEAKEYSLVEKFYADIDKAVNKSSVPFRDPQRGFIACRRGTWQAPTGTLYSWRSYPQERRNPITKLKETVDQFSTPELKNYPIQGTSGEFVIAILGKLFRHFVEVDNYNQMAFLVNTVHDCVWIDCHKSIVERVASAAKKIMESIPELFNDTFDMDITVPFPVEVEYGDNMLELHHM